MTINNAELFMAGFWDWGCLDGCFGETKIKPTDIDGFVERNGRFLIFETKKPNADIPMGQQITFDRLIELGVVTVVIIWGLKNKPERIRLLTSRILIDYPNADMETLQHITRKWFEWADKQTPAPMFTEGDNKHADRTA